MTAPRFRQCSARSSRSGGAISPRAWSRLSACRDATMATVSTRAITLSDNYVGMCTSNGLPISSILIPTNARITPRPTLR